MERFFSSIQPCLEFSFCSRGKMGWENIKCMATAGSEAVHLQEQRADDGSDGVMHLAESTALLLSKSEQSPEAQWSAKRGLWGA